MNPISERFRRATDLALNLHATQTRKKSSIPYVSHLFAVSAIAMEHGADEDEAIAALLHDAVEDQGGEPTLVRIREAFGPRVADIVWGCTDGIEDDEGQREPWRLRKERYLAHLAEAGRSVLLVSNADKLHNTRCVLHDLRHQAPGEDTFQRFTGKRDGTLWYYRALADAFLERSRELMSDDSHLERRRAALAEDMDLAVRELHRLAGESE